MVVAMGTSSLPHVSMASVPRQVPWTRWCLTLQAQWIVSIPGEQGGRCFPFQPTKISSSAHKFKPSSKMVMLNPNQLIFTGSP